MNIGGGGNSVFNYSLLILAVVLMVGMPLCINLFAPQYEVDEYQEVIDQLNNEYKNMTGSAPVREDVWALTGIYTPYEAGGPYGYTYDGWLYGTQVHNYQPSQYSAGNMSYSVTDLPTIDGEIVDKEFYQYDTVGAGYSGIEAGNIYTSVSMDVNQKSNIFFTPENKTTVGSKFYYEYTGYRYAFQPVTDITGVDDNGDSFKWTKNSSSCSLIWYQYYNVSEGVAGQIVINKQDGGTAYITAESIINAFNSQNNTAKFNLQFNGVKLNLYVRMDSYYTSTGLSIQECFNAGYWSVMLTSETVDSSGYIATDYSFNPQNIFNTTVDLLTFNLDSYGFSPFVGVLCSLVVVLPLYVGLLVIGLDNYPVLILAGILLAIQGIVTAGGWLGGLFG